MESLLYNCVLDILEQIDSSNTKVSVSQLVGQLGLSKFTGSFLMVSANSLRRLVDFH